MTERLKSQQREYEAQMEHRKHVQEFIDKFRFNAKRASLVQSRYEYNNEKILTGHSSSELGKGFMVNKMTF